MGGQHFFFQAADGQDAPAQGDLAGHGDVFADGAACERGSESRGKGDAR